MKMSIYDIGVFVSYLLRYLKSNHLTELPDELFSNLVNLVLL